VNSLHKMVNRFCPFKQSEFFVRVKYPTMGKNDITELFFRLQDQLVLVYHREPFTSGGAGFSDSGWRRFLLFHEMAMSGLNSPMSGWSPMNPKQQIRVEFWHRTTSMMVHSGDSEDCAFRHSTKQRRIPRFAGTSHHQGKA